MDRQTDGHLMTAQSMPCIALHSKNYDTQWFTVMRQKKQRQFIFNKHC